MTMSKVTGTMEGSVKVGGEGTFGQRILTKKASPLAKNRIEKCKGVHYDYLVPTFMSNCK